MTAADITTKVSENVHLPGMEVVVLTATDDETYTSKKFKKILGVVGTIMEDAARDFAVSISGQIVTIRSTGLDDKKVCLVIFGRK